MTSFTGLTRRRSTTPLVAIVDRLCRYTITFGGIGTIVAVLGVCLFLLWVALPLMGGGSVTAASTAPRASERPVVAAAEDDYRRAAWTLHDDGTAIAFATADGKELSRQVAFDPQQVSRITAHGDQVLLGGRDGSVQLLRIEFSSDVIDSSDAPAALTATTGPRVPGTVAIVDGVLYEFTQEGQWRRQQLRVSHDAPVQLGSAAVLQLDAANTARGELLTALTADGVLHFKARTTRENLLTGEQIVTLRGASVPVQDLVPGFGAAAQPDLPDRLLLAGAGSSVYLIWNDGRLLRLDTRDIDAPRFTESVQLVPQGRRVSAVAFAIGRSTLLVGDDRGTVAAWFWIKPKDAQTADGQVLVQARTFAHAGSNGSEVVALHASTRSRLFVAAHKDGRAEVLHGTSGRLVAKAQVPADDALQQLLLTPKEDGMLAIGARRIHRWDLQPGHPEVTLASAFTPVWYEGDEAPTHTWQSTSGSDDFEPKLGLWVLVFGTLKATFYCLLFGVPLALLAAIYTSEFLHSRRKARIKPLIELMASLPSVVLGFLAALVFAPVVETHLMALLTMTLTVPLLLLLGAQLWQLVPAAHRQLADRWRIPAALLVVPLGIGLALLLAPLLQTVLFGGDIHHWLAVATQNDALREQGASAFGGWFFALLPLAATASAFGITWFGARLPFMPDSSLGRFAIGTGLALLLTTLLGSLLTVSGFDLRGNLMGTFDQRNSLVVGFVMGFAVIPIIYTIAEDALSAVPEHLRAASLGAGATPWQTAVRIILPTAMSGVFSAVMVGLGRAVGETMIVLMAAGNTPLLEMNVFNGFRTLSANIATELPEAVRDSTHYRTLYLAALCLFVMTFVLNTVAEVVRQRFRKRAFQL